MKNFVKKVGIFIFIFLITINFNTHYFNNNNKLLVEKFEAKASNVDFFVNVILVCGDGYTDPFLEFCDPGNPGEGVPPDVGTTTCQDFIDPYSGQPYVSGDLTCSNDCSAYATSTCYTCGNGHLESPMEECDIADFGGFTCGSFGYTGGNIRCTNFCRFNLSECYTSGTTEPTPGSSNTSGGSSGGATGYYPGEKDPPRDTVVIIKGKAYPNAEVRILIDGKVVGIVKADSKADFDFEIDDVTPGVTTFGLWSEDNRGLKSTLLSLTFRVASKSITTISNVYISPTIDIDKKRVKKGDNLKIFGKSSPDVNLNVHINSPKEIVEKTASNISGDWSLLFNTKELEEDFHTVKAIIRLEKPESIIESNFSQTVSFYIGDKIPEQDCGVADLNCDGFVNLIDFSILLFNWGSKNENSDINKDGIVGLADFSIMMYYWTG